MPHQGKFNHSFLIRHSVLVGKEVLTSLFFLTVAQSNGILAYGLKHNTIKITVNKSQTISYMKSESLSCIVMACILQICTIAFCDRKNLNLFLRFLSAGQLKVFFCHPFYKSLVKGVSRIQVIDQFLIVFHQMFVLAFANCKFWESSAIAQH